MGVMGGTPGNNGHSANSALAVMFGGKDRLGRSRIWLPWDQAVTRPLARAMTLLKY